MSEAASGTGGGKGGGRSGGGGVKEEKGRGESRARSSEIGRILNMRNYNAKPPFCHPMARPSSHPSNKPLRILIRPPAMRTPAPAN